MVTYSIEAVVSHNINQELGMDSYYWSYDDELVDKVLYFSGDSSSITFVAGTIPDAGANLTVAIGRKNKPLGYSTYTLSILPEISEPVFYSGYEPTKCLGLSTTTTTDTIIVKKQTGAVYSWDFGVYDIVYLSAVGDTVVIRPNNASQTIKLTVTGACSEPLVREYEINRSLTHGVNSILVTGQTAPYCLNPETNYSLLLNNVCASEKIIWGINGDWTLEKLTNTNTPVVKTGLQRAIISASTASCPSVVLTDTFTIKPKAPIQIFGKTCIGTGSETNTFSVTPIKSADFYEWEYPTGWKVQGSSTSNEITFITDGSAGTLKVRANGCTSSNWLSTEISIAANTPVIKTQPSCYNTHLPNEFSLSITPVEGEVYQWIIPSSFTLVSSNQGNDSIIVSTNTFDLINEQVQVFAQTGCGNSDTTNISIINSEEGLSVKYYDAMPPFIPKNFHYINGYNGYAISSTLLIDGQSYPDSVQINNGNSAELLTTYQGDLQLKTGWLLVLDCKKDGCTVRIIYGDTNYYTYSDVYSIVGSSLRTSSLKSASSFEENSEPNTLTLFPNPASGIVNLKLKNRTNAKKVIMVYDITGNLVLNKTSKANKLQIDTQSWKSGNYVVAVKIGDEVFKDILVKK